MDFIRYARRVIRLLHTPHLNARLRLAVEVLRCSLMPLGDELPVADTRPAPLIDRAAASPKALPLRADGRCFEVGLFHSFLEYGLWQDYGTGRETPRGNSGDLGRAKKRQRRRWFSRKYYASVMRLKEFYEENVGREFCGIMSDFAQRLNK